jgi:hypothetical protein
VRAALLLTLSFSAASTAFADDKKKALQFSQAVQKGDTALFMQLVGNELTVDSYNPEREPPSERVQLRGRKQIKIWFDDAASYETHGSTNLSCKSHCCEFKWTHKKTDAVRYLDQVCLDPKGKAVRSMKFGS